MVGVNLRSNRYIRISHEFPENIDGYAGCLEVRTVRMFVTIQHQVIRKGYGGTNLFRYTLHPMDMLRACLKISHIRYLDCVLYLVPT